MKTFLTTFDKKAFDNIDGKEDNADYQHFFPFPTLFYTQQKTHSKSVLILNLSCANAFRPVQNLSCRTEFKR